MTQAIALSGIRHTNIAQFYGVLMAGDGSGIEWIVSELADASSLKTFIRSSVDAHTPLEVDMLLSFAKYMMRGLTYLHTKSPAIIHGHVKPSNCLLFLSFGGGMTLKLSMAMDEAEGVGASRSSDAVYDAPEAADGEQSSKSDVFSVGVVLCEMVYSLLRVGPRDLARDRTGYLADAIMALRPLSPSLADVIQACTVPSVAARCDSLEALERLESIRSTVSVSRALRAGLSTMSFLPLSSSLPYHAVPRSCGGLPVLRSVQSIHPVAQLAR